MKVTLMSGLTGVVHSREIDFKMEDFLKWKYEGMLIQDAMPYLSADDREFLKTGITPEEWATYLGEEEDGLQEGSGQGSRS